MKILHALQGWPTGGPGPTRAAEPSTERYVERLAALQVAAGHEVAVAAGSPSDRYPEGFHRVGDGAVLVHRISRPGPCPERWDHTSSPAVDAAFGRLLRESSPDVVHVHGWQRLSQALVRQAAAQGVPSVVSLHDCAVTCPRLDRVRADEPYCERAPSVASCLGCVPRERWSLDPATSASLRRYFREADAEVAAAGALVVPSVAHARLLARFTELPEERFQVLPPPPSLARREPAGAPWTPAASRPLRVAHWGALEAHEGAYVLLEALGRLEREAEVELVLWGSAADEDYALALEELADGQEIQRRETFTPADLEDLAADLAVFPTLSHDAGGEAVEAALALGLPVLVSDRGALPERCGDAGLAFPPDDYEALADLLERVLDEPDLLARLRAAIPSAPAAEDHALALVEVYERARQAASAPDVSATWFADREQWERVATALEEQGRDLAGLRNAAELETRGLRDEVETEFAALCEERARSHAVRAELGETTGALHALEARLAEREGELHGLEVRLAGQEAERNTVVHALEARLTELDRQVHELEARRAERENAAQALEVRLAQGAAERNTVVHALESRLGEQHEISGRLEGRLAEAEGRLADAAAQLVNRDTQLSERDARLAERDGKIQGLEARIAEHEAELSTAAARFEGAEAEHLARADQLTARVAELERRLREVERENRLAAPLTLPVRGVLRMWDKIKSS